MRLDCGLGRYGARVGRPDVMLIVGIEFVGHSCWNFNSAADIWRLPRPGAGDWICFAGGGGGRVREVRFIEHAVRQEIASTFSLYVYVRGAMDNTNTCPYIFTDLPDG